MTLDKGHRELTEADLDLVSGAKKINELKEEAKEVAKQAGDSSDHKGFGGAGALFGV